jgi:hypothetical protein
MSVTKRPAALVLLQQEVGFGDDPDQHAHPIDDRKGAHAELVHEADDFLEGRRVPHHNNLLRHHVLHGALHRDLRSSMYHANDRTPIAGVLGSIDPRDAVRSARR